MTDFSPLDSALYESTPEKIAASLRYLRKADAVMAALMPLSANPQAPPAADYVGDAGPATDDDFVDLPAAVPAANVTPRDGKWVFSDNDEVFRNFDYETELSAIDDALVYYPDAETIYVGQVKTLDVRRLIRADHIIENIGERACDEVGGAADSWPELSEIQQAELEGIIADYILSKSPADFYSVKNMRVYTREQAEEMLAAALAANKKDNSLWQDS